MSDVRPTHPRILIIEDDDVSREVFREILGGHGYSILEAVDGEAGLQILKSNPVDLVITDFQLPGMTGVDLAAGAKELAPQTPVILLTGWLTDDIVSEETCCDFVLSKPCPFPLLIETMEKALAGGRAKAS